MSNKTGFADRFSRKLGYRKSSGLEQSISSDYIFSFEDGTSRAAARAALSFTPVCCDKSVDGNSKENRYVFEYQSAFEYGENSGNAAGSGESDKYNTIFTYSKVPESDVLLTNSENPVGTQTSWRESGAALVLYGLSGLLLATLFPILCWVYVKRVSQNERLIVFRLGKRLKLKGPGFVFLLPFCDRFCSIRLDEQTFEVGPVSGGTEDEALVEVRASGSYRLTDPEYACMTVKETPTKLLIQEAQLCLLSSLGRLTWACLNDGTAVRDLTLNTTTSLNFRCSSFGIQVTNIEILNLSLVRPPPSPDTLQEQRMSIVQKQLRAISSALFPKISAVSSKTVDYLFAKPVGAEHVPTEGHAPTTERGASQPVFSESPSTTLLCKNVCQQTIERARTLLKNSLVCHALGYKRMQVIVSPSQLSHPLPDLVEASKNESFCSFYLDAGNGHADFGLLPASEPPDVTLYICVNDLSDAVRGKLNLLDAVHRRAVFISGDDAVFNKLRHLLHF